MPTPTWQPWSAEVAEPRINLDVCICTKVLWFIASPQRLNRLTINMILFNAAARTQGCLSQRLSLRRLPIWAKSCLVNFGLIDQRRPTHDLALHLNMISQTWRTANRKPSSNSNIIYSELIRPTTQPTMTDAIWFNDWLVDQNQWKHVSKSWW